MAKAQGQLGTPTRKEIVLSAKVGMGTLNQVSRALDTIESYLAMNNIARLTAAYSKLPEKARADLETKAPVFDRLRKLAARFA